MRLKADVTDAELAVLKLLWELGPSTIRRLADQLYPGGDASHYATVQKLLDRLQTKGCVRRDADARVNVYSATVARDTLIAHRLRETADKLCGGALTPLLTHLVNTSSLSDEDLAALRRLVEQHEQHGQGED